MGANPLLGPLERVGPEDLDFFGPKWQVLRLFYSILIGFLIVFYSILIVFLRIPFSAGPPSPPPSCPPGR
jgi:hypothetical protein